MIVAAFLADAERAYADDAARLMLVVGGVTLLGAAAAAWLVAGRILRPLRDVAETARTITDTDLSGRIPHAGDADELGDLVRTVNAMLDRVETGVAAQRRFVDDAGHELRTPITIVRGHLEVLDPTDADDVRTTVALVDDELSRMNRMVSDLLLLARSEQPTFLHPEPVDVADLTADTFGKVERLGERDWVLETAARVDAVLDPQRITQAVVALADNACRHTGPGDRIGIGSQLTGGWLRFWVSDTGPGVSPADRARIFERFSRGTEAGPRSDGAGLGLSIVRAIAVAHGGQVLLDSVPGRGATFTVVIPAVVRQEGRERACELTIGHSSCRERGRRAPARRTREPDPDRRGRAAHRRVRREGAVGQRVRRDGGRRRALGVRLRADRRVRPRGAGHRPARRRRVHGAAQAQGRAVRTFP